MSEAFNQHKQQEQPVHPPQPAHTNHIIIIPECDIPELPLVDLQAVFDHAISEEGLGSCQLTVLFIDQQRCSELHQEHFDDPSITDVMSFPDGSEDPATGAMLLGDLAVCPAVAQEASTRSGNTIEQELLLYIIHGTLHLLGYDDHDPDDRAEMWQRQEELLRPLGIRVIDQA